MVYGIRYIGTDVFRFVMIARWPSTFFNRTLDIVFIRDHIIPQRYSSRARFARLRPNAVSTDLYGVCYVLSHVPTVEFYESTKYVRPSAREVNRFTS